MDVREAFEQWCGDDWDKERMESCWKAACEWQKQQDAEIAKTCFVGWPLSGANQRLECANAIMRQQDK